MAPAGVQIQFFSQEKVTLYERILLAERNVSRPSAAATQDETGYERSVVTFCIQKFIRRQKNAIKEDPCIPIVLFT